MRPARRLLLLAAAIAGSVHLPAAAQKIQCMVPGEPASANQRCSIAVPSGTVTQPLAVQLLNPGGVAGKVVHFSLAPGASGTVTDSAVTDVNGIAPFAFTGQGGSSGSTVIRAEARLNNQVTFREIEIVTAPPPATSRNLSLGGRQRVQHWFAERQLRDSIEVVVENPTGDCSSNIVVFRATSSTDGTTSPDSVRPTVVGGRCVATSWWKLGNTVGRQHMRAFLASEPAKTVSMTAIGRAGPRIGVGVAFVRDMRNYQTLDSATNRVVDANHDWQSTPTVAADFPIIPSARWMRGVMAVSLKDASRDWYVGFSVLQPMLGVTRESVDLDLELVMHAGRRNVLKDRSCDDDGDISDCVNRKDKVLPLGIGFMAFVNAANLISSIQNIFK
jgi:hypothetical protein